MVRDSATSTRRSCGNSTPTTFLDVYSRLFVNRVTPVLRAAADGSWFSQRTRLTKALLRNALKGETTLGLYSVSESGLSMWACLDVDDDGDLPALAEALGSLPSRGHVLAEVSRRGAHIWLFFARPVPWEDARRYGQRLMQSAGITCEVFPKGPTLSGVRAPLTRHPKTGSTYGFIDPATGEHLKDSQATLRSIVPLWLPPQPPLPEPTFERRDLFSSPLTLPVKSRNEQHRELVDEVTKYTRLKYIGPERLMGRCPFHRPDKNPSFGVLGAYWRCWANCLGEGRSHGGINSFRARVREKGL